VYFVLEAEDEVFEGAGDEVVGVKYLLESVGELSVVLQHVRHLLLNLRINSLGKYGLGHEHA